MRYRPRLGPALLWVAAGALLLACAHGTGAAGVGNVHPASTTHPAGRGSVQNSVLVAAHASPASGPAPLTVQFSAAGSGGTVPYISYLWNFDDGSNGTGPAVEYTFFAPGNYTVTVMVTDSASHSGVGVVVVHVAPTPVVVAASGSQSLVLVGGVAIAVAAAVTVIGLRLGLRRWGRGRSTSTDVGSIPSPSMQLAAPTGLIPLAAGATATAGIPAASPTLSNPTAPSFPEPTAATAELRLSERIILHLALHGAHPLQPLARIESTQPGMGRTFGATQSAVSNVLRRLQAAGVVATQLRHVAGHPRRLRTYALTPRGEQLAADLRIRMGSGRAPLEGPSTPGQVAPLR